MFPASSEALRCLDWMNMPSCEKMLFKSCAWYCVRWFRDCRWNSNQLLWTKRWFVSSLPAIDADLGTFLDAAATNVGPFINNTSPIKPITIKCRWWSIFFRLKLFIWFEFVRFVIFVDIQSLWHLQLVLNLKRFRAIAIAICSRDTGRAATVVFVIMIILVLLKH